MLFQKPVAANEIINDLDEELINAYRVLMSNPDELAALLWATPFSPVNWRQSHQHLPMSQLERARLYIAKSSQFYAGDQQTSTWAGHFKSDRTIAKSLTWGDWFKRVYPAFLRLKNVTILCEDAVKAIERVSAEKNCLIYADPPYVTHERQYTEKLNYETFIHAITKAKAKVVVSEESAALRFYRGWYRIPLVRNDRGKGIRSKKTREWLLFNYDPFTGGFLAGRFGSSQCRQKRVRVIKK